MAYHGEDVSILWNGRTDEPVVDHTRNCWTEYYVQWSPQGSYLTTMHRQGVALWGGASWNKMQRFSHPGVKLASFSPNEAYLVTWSNDSIRGTKPPVNLVIWDVQTGLTLRTFATPKKSVPWPLFRWSHDGKMVARVTENAIACYTLPDMTLLDRKSIAIPGIKDLSWSPTQNILAYWTPEDGPSPARVTLMEMPSRRLLRVKNVFNVTSVSSRASPSLTHVS